MNVKCTINETEWWPVFEPRGMRRHEGRHWENHPIGVPRELIERHWKARREFERCQEELERYAEESHRLKRETSGIVIGADGFILEPGR